MPQLGQIIPSYRVPHVMSVINDNTQFTDPVAPVENGPSALHVFGSSRGRDRVLLDIKSPTDWINEYGRPDYGIFGQAPYNAYAWLSGAQSISYSMRVTPDDAAFANLIVLAKVKADDVAKTIEVRFEAVQEQQLREEEDFASQVEVQADPVADANGFVTYPLFGAWVLGRGEYGNGFRIRLTSAAQADKENDFKNYNLEVLEIDGSLTRHKYFTGTLAPNALIGTTSQYLVDRVNDPDSGSQHIGLYVAEDTITAIFDKYKSYHPETTLTVEDFDFIGGKTKTQAAIPGYTIGTTGEFTISLGVPDGIGFDGGDDGSFAATVDAGIREEKLDEAYVKAFAGEYDRRVMSKYRAPMTSIIDAGYSLEVKRALIDLIRKRGDAMGTVDAGIIASRTDLISWGEEMAPLQDRIYTKEGQHYKVRDPFTGRPITVTITHFISQALPIHIAAYGANVPFVGEDYAMLRGAIKGSLKPVIDIDDLDTKEALYNLNVNVFHQVSNSVAVRSTQETSQAISSDLSEENNMRVLLNIKRAIEVMNAGLTYDFAEEDDRKQFTDDGMDVIKKFAGQYRSASIRFAMTPFEEERSILHCYVDVIFKTMAKRSIIEIDVNRRV